VSVDGDCSKVANQPVFMYMDQRESKSETRSDQRPVALPSWNEHHEITVHIKRKANLVSHITACAFRA
jgi:hypothetical protein